MPNPQIEDGYTKIANELLEALAKIRISGVARQVFDVILRKTYGVNKVRDKISLKQMQGFTGLKKPVIVRAREKLLEMNLINVINNDNGKTTTYWINKRYNTWKPLSKKITLSKMITGVDNNDKKSLSLLRPTKDSYTKETLTKETYTEEFEFVWKLFGCWGNKPTAFRYWLKLSPTDRIDIKEKIPQYVKSTSDKGYRKHFQGWINPKNRHWEDKIVRKKNNNDGMSFMDNLEG